MSVTSSDPRHPLWSWQPHLESGSPKTWCKLKAHGLRCVVSCDIPPEQTKLRCEVVNSDKLPGTDCRCSDGFKGEISWDGPHPKGNCTEAPCHTRHSGGLGLNCRCSDGFEGEIFWKKDEAYGSCRPAQCRVENSNKLPGLQCKCLNFYTGQIRWDGLCAPLRCEGHGVNDVDGPGCECKGGYNGTVKVEVYQSNISQFLRPDCSPAGCNIANSTGDGPDCRCADGFNGEIFWRKDKAFGYCRPAPCQVKNSNKLPGP